MTLLTSDNHKAWFRRMKVRLNGKGVFYVVEKPLQTYAGVAGFGSGTFEDMTITNNGIPATVRINLEKKAQYQKDEATAFELMFRALDVDDQALVDEYDTVFTFWAYLKTKYSETDMTAANTYMTANKYMTLIQTFTFEPDQTIAGAWDKLKGYRRKLGAADASAKTAYHDSTLLLILIRSLPKEFETTIDTISAQSTLSVEAKLKHLEAKQIRLQEDKEHGHAAFKVRKSSKYITPHRRYEQDSDSSSDDRRTESKYICYLCDGKHFLRNCPYLDVAKEAVQEQKAQEK